MGNGIFQSSQLRQKYPFISNQVFQPKYWENITQNNNPFKKSQYGYYQTFRHYVTKQQIDKYQVICLNKQQYQFYIESFAWRMRQQFFVNSVYLQQSDRPICSFQRKLNVYIPHMPLRLDDITDIPYPYQITTLRNVLLGYRKLYQYIGFFKVKQSQICINYDGNIKVWMNSDLSKNIIQNENYTHTEDIYSESEMTKQILEIIFNNIDETSQPYPLYKYIYQKLKIFSYNKFHSKKKITFDDALQALQSYAQEYKSQVPQSFKKIIQILLQGNYEKFLNGKSYPLIQNQNYISGKKKKTNQENEDHQYYQFKESCQANKLKQNLKNNSQYYLKNKSSMKNLLNQHFYNSPKFKPIENNFFRSIKPVHKRGISLPSEIPIQLFKDRLKPKQKIQSQLIINPNKASQDLRKEQVSMQTSYQKIRVNSERQPNRHININQSFNGNNLLIHSVNNAFLMKQRQNQYVTSSNSISFSQSIYNKKNHRALIQISSKPATNIYQTPRYISNHLTQFTNKSYPLFHHQNDNKTLFNGFPSRIQQLKGNNQAKSFHYKNIPHSHSVTLNINNQNYLPTFRNFPEMPSQVAQVTEQKSSSYQISSVVQVQISNTTSQNYNKSIEQNQSEEQNRKIIKSEVQRVNVNLEKKNQSKNKPDSLNIIFQSNRSMKQQKKSKDCSLNNPTQQEQHQNSRYSHFITKNDNHKIDDKKNINSNQMLFSHLLSQNKSDHIQEKEKQQYDKSKDLQKAQSQIRQSARKQFMMQIHALSETYKKSLNSNSQKKGFQHMMQSLLSNYCDNQSYILPQSSYSETKKIPKKVPGVLLIQNSAVKEAPFKTSLDPQIMKDLKKYQTTKMKQI